MLIKYTGKYVNIYFNMKITYFKTSFLSSSHFCAIRDSSKEILVNFQTDVYILLMNGLLVHGRKHFQFRTRKSCKKAY